MKHTLAGTKWLGASAVALMALVGCTGADQNGDGKTADSATGARLEQAGDQAGDAAGTAADVATDAAGRAADNVADTASKIAPSLKDVDDAAMTPIVKTALANNAALKGTQINVDSKDKGVILRGTVKSQTQKGLAERIAKQAAPSYKIINQLTVKK
jgi:osmotically-inducible protein OsmY